jgi:hypothetical protein
MIIDFQLVSKNLPLTLLYGEAAVELYGQQRRHKAARKYAVDVLLTNLFVAFQARRGLKIPMRDSYYRNLPAKKSHFVGFLKLLIKDKLLKWERGAIRADGTREFNTYWPTYDFFRCIELTHRHRSAARRQGLVEAHTIQFERLKSPHCYIVQKDGKNSDPYPNKAEDYKALKASAKLLAKHSFSLFRSSCTKTSAYIWRGY